LYLVNYFFCLPFVAPFLPAFFAGLAVGAGAELPGLAGDTAATRMPGLRGDLRGLGLPGLATPVYTAVSNKRAKFGGASGRARHLQMEHSPTAGFPRERAC
jgi:hypothetical protein